MRKRFAVLGVVLAVVVNTGCTHGLPRSQQNEAVQGVVNACWSSGGRSETKYTPAVATTVLCRWPDAE